MWSAMATTRKPTRAKQAAAAEARKGRSLAALRRLRVPTLADLPAIHAGKPRSAKVITDRIIALQAVALRAFKAPADLQADFATRFPWQALLSPDERGFMKTARPTPMITKAMTWRCEALEVLLWSVGFRDALPGLAKLIDPQTQLDLVMAFQSPAALRRAARGRDHAELLDLSDLMYRAHWAVRDAELARRPVPKALDRGVIIERDHASRWLLGLGGLAWDDVSLDT